MAELAQFNLAIETSSRHGSMALGRGDGLLGTVQLPEQRRHAVELMPAIDRLAREYGASPTSIGEIYVSVGPGSFTGLRVAVTTAKVLSRVTGAHLVAAPTLRVVAANAPKGAARIAVMLNAKGGRWFTAVYEDGLEIIAPTLMTPEQLVDHYRGPVLGDHPPEGQVPAGLEWLDPALAVPRATVVWQIGREMAREGRFTPALALAPLYVRLPEAQELWQARNTQKV